MFVVQKGKERNSVTDFPVLQQNQLEFWFVTCVRNRDRVGEEERRRRIAHVCKVISNTDMDPFDGEVAIVKIFAQRVAVKASYTLVQVIQYRTVMFLAGSTALELCPIFFLS